MNVKPKFDRRYSPHPLGRALGRASSMPILAKLSNVGQSGSLCLSHGSGRVGGWLLGAQTVQKAPGFLLGTDRSYLQNGLAITCLNEALVVAHLIEVIHHVHNATMVGRAVEQAKYDLVPGINVQVRPMSVAGQLIFLPKLRDESANDTSARKIGACLFLVTLAANGGSRRYKIRTT
ncbi:hypothetical protein AB8B21_02540 [Tardiphaga sp. 866_E4_N2_1]|uniref:hypothetical protein n=1 Tax=Tardiphaga sp. 866_E4_N2_1 TaxID=3240767 RepID=UPI003F22CC74